MMKGAIDLGRIYDDELVRLDGDDIIVTLRFGRQMNRFPVGPVVSFVDADGVAVSGCLDGIFVPSFELSCELPGPLCSEREVLEARATVVRGVGRVCDDLVGLGSIDVYALWRVDLTVEMVVGTKAGKVWCRLCLLGTIPRGRVSVVERM